MVRRFTNVSIRSILEASDAAGEKGVRWSFAVRIGYQVEIIVVGEGGEYSTYSWHKPAS